MSCQKYEKRERLADVLPIKTPYTVDIFPLYACNLKCEFCMMSLPKDGRYAIDADNFDIALYKKLVDSMKNFSQKVKILRFVGWGEPLLHKHIVEMVDYATRSQVAEKTEILTNGVALNKSLSDGLINAGLSSLRISINGLSDADYLRICNQQINFDEMVHHIEYFYKNRKQVKVRIKTIDYIVESPKDKSRFYELFEPICDVIDIEYLQKTSDRIDYDQMAKGKDYGKTARGFEGLELKVCPYPFFRVQINPDGKVVACCSDKYPAVLGNIKNDDLDKIWNGDIANQFRYDMLDKTIEFFPECQNCNLIRCISFPEDNLDEDAERLKLVYSAGLK